MNERIMIIGAHNDECEYGTGGIAYLLSQRGCKVRFLCLSGLWVKTDYSKEDEKEWIRQETESAKILGADKVILGTRDANICEYDREFLLKVEKEILEFKPDIAIIHHPEDNHIEHRIAARLAFDALCIAPVHRTRVKEVYSFEAGPNQTGDYFFPDFSIDITEAMDKVRESLKTFNQPTANGNGLSKEKDVCSAYRGHVAGFDYAEGFRIVKFPDANNDFLLKNLLNDKFRWYGKGMYPAKGISYFGC